MTYSKVEKDTYTITFDEVESIVRQISVSYAHIRRSYLQHVSEIDNLLDAGKINQTVLCLRHVYGLPTGFIKSILYKQKLNGLAQIQFFGDPLTRHYHYAHIEFKDNKADLLQQPRYRLIHMIAHELAHARLKIDRHPLERSEFATDILALVATGYKSGYDKAMLVRDGNLSGQYGYIRRELLYEVYRCLNMYADRFYMK